ncbi:MAG: M56 family metallopeptidase [Bacteroidota bacterium]
MTMVPYILKSSACLALFWIFYKVFLERENMHALKRFYLLIATACAFAFPWITFTEYVEVAGPVLETSYMENSGESLMAHFYVSESGPQNPYAWLWGIYFLGAVFFALRFARNLFLVFRRIQHNPRLRRKHSILVLLQEKTLPHTFLNFVFLNRSLFRAKRIPREVLLHEEAHATQKHSLDILFLEILQILFWFNPLLLLMRNTIKMNHEFLADRAVTEQGIPTASYQETVLVYSSNQYRPFPFGMGMANAINHSSFSFIRAERSRNIKKRFTIMKKRTSKSAIAIRCGLMLPLLALLLFGFSETKTVILENPVAKTLPEGSATPSSSHKADPEDDSLLSTERSRQDGLTKKQMREYNALAAKYNKMLAKDDSIFIKGSDVDRLVYLHGHMTEAQREKAEPFPDFPEPPKAPLPPLELHEELSVLQEQMVQQQLEMERQTQIMAEQHLVIERQARDIKSKYQEMEQQATLGEKEQREMEREALEMETQRQEMEQKAFELEQKALEMEQKALEMEREAQEMKIPKPKTPPVPPAPKSPVEHIREMAQKDAIFFHNGKKINADRAIEVLHKNGTIKVETRHENLERPEVRISTETIKTSLNSRTPLKKVQLVFLMANDTEMCNTLADRLLKFKKSCCSYAQYYCYSKPISTGEALHVFVKNKKEKIVLENINVPGLSLRCSDPLKKS